MRVVLTQLPNWTDDAEANFRLAADATGGVVDRHAPVDLVVLPELIGAESSRAEYEMLVSRLAVRLGCHVVGGSHHRWSDGVLTNCGAVANAGGEIILTFEKQHPYGSEVALGVSGGSALASFAVAGRRVLPVICSDVWFSELFLDDCVLPDLMVVPTFSISQRPAPDSAQALWSHMAVARAYEFATYVGVSDWAHPSLYRGLASSGVAGLADPRPLDRRSFFRPLAGVAARCFDLDFQRLAGLRRSRIDRGFLRRPGTARPSHGSAERRLLP